MKYNRDFAIKGALVVAILIVIGVSAHLYAKKKREHFDFEMNSLTGFSKGTEGTDGTDGEDGEDGEEGEEGTDGDSAFNIARILTPSADWASNATGKEWLNSLKGKDWDSANVWAPHVTAAAGETKVDVNDIVSYIIAEVNAKMPPPVPSVPLGTIMAYHIGHNSALTNLSAIKGYLNPLGWVVCDGKLQFNANMTVLGSGKTPPDLRGRFLYQQRNISTKEEAFPNDGMGLSVDAFDGDVTKQNTAEQSPEGKVIINSTQMPSHIHNVPDARQTVNRTGTVAWTGGSGDAHADKITSVSDTPLNSAATGGGQPLDIRPPYFSVIYIMKVA
jgi:microcystin-dependent protein